MAVPLIWTAKVMKQASSVIIHFFRRGQLNGFAGSDGPFQLIIVTREGVSDRLKSLVVDSKWISSADVCSEAGEVSFHAGDGVDVGKH